MIRITLRPMRFYLFGRRVHHALLGLLLVLSDLHDWRVWIRDFVTHPQSTQRRV